MQNIIRFFSEHQDKIILIIGAILIAAIGFAAGRLSVQEINPEPITIEETENLCSCTEQEGKVLGTAEEEKSDTNIKEKIEEEQAPFEQTSKEGKYVGSKSSNKYHYPDCRYAKKIKEQNQIWFSSAKEAQEAGYQPCGVCKPPSSD